MATTASGTYILPCKCVSLPQDRLYGRGLRVHNSLGKKRQQGGLFWRCTVCKAEKGG